MAHKKAGGSAGTNRDSVSKRLGVKRYGGESVSIGDIIIRQKGSHVYPGAGTKRGNDFTIYAVLSGKVHFLKKRGRSVVQVDASTHSINTQDRTGSNRSTTSSA